MLGVLTHYENEARSIGKTANMRRFSSSPVCNPLAAGFSKDFYCRGQRRMNRTDTEARADLSRAATKRAGHPYPRLE
jgi:hypothetical protein